jgi:hypothetical protein
MAYTVNGTALTFQPTRGRWNEQKELATDGNNRPIYPAVWEYELFWDGCSPAFFSTLRGLWEGTSTTGTAVITLPDPDSTIFEFKEYSGTVFEKPKMSEYFADTGLLQITMLVRNVHDR